MFKKNPESLQTEIAIESHKITLPYHIKERHLIAGIWIFLFEIPQGYICNENIWAFNENGQKIWEIPSVKHISEDSPYSGIIPNGDFEIICCNWDGGRVFLDIRNGSILREDFGK